MGWNGFKMPISLWLVIPLMLLGLFPGLIVFLINWRGRKYAAQCPQCGQSIALSRTGAIPLRGTDGREQYYEDGVPVSQARAVGLTLVRAGKWVLIGAVGLVVLLFVLGGLGMLIQRMGYEHLTDPGSPQATGSQNSTTTSGTNSSGLRALGYVGRMPDLQFFELREIRGSLARTLPTESLEAFTPDEWPHLDCGNVTLNGRMLAVNWQPAISTGLIGGILALDIDTRSAIIAEQKDEPIIKIYGEYDTIDPSKLPQVISEWLNDRSKATVEVAHKQPQLVFVTKNGEDLLGRLATAGIANPASVDSFLDALKSSMRKDQKDAVARLMSYPLFVDVNGQARKVNSPDEFRADYDRIVTASVKQAVASATLSNLFAHSEGVMIGKGEIWFSAFNGGHLLVTQIHVL